MIIDISNRGNGGSGGVEIDAYSKQQSDTRYAKKSETYSMKQCDDKFATKDVVKAYTKAESDAKYRTINDSYSKSDIDGKGYLTEVPADYQTTAVADGKYQEKGNYITEIPAEYVTETELTAKDYVDNTTLNNKGYLTAVPDTYATKEYVDGLIKEANNILSLI